MPKLSPELSSPTSLCSGQECVDQRSGRRIGTRPEVCGSAQQWQEDWYAARGVWRVQDERGAGCVMCRTSGVQDA